MTDWDLLDKKIEESGIKRSFLYKKLGITRAAWSKRRARNIDFKAGDILTIVELLHLTKSEREQIFFAKM